MGPVAFYARSIAITSHSKPVACVVTHRSLVVSGQHQGKFVAYFRVSTQRQGRSGLGLEAQRRAVEEFLNGGHWKLVEEFTEVESGKRGVERPVLDQALAACRVHKATLIIAKLDRLARNVEF